MKQKKLIGVYKQIFKGTEHGDYKHRRWLFKKIREIQNKNMGKPEEELLGMESALRPWRE